MTDRSAILAGAAVGFATTFVGMVFLAVRMVRSGRVRS